MKQHKAVCQALSIDKNMHLEQTWQETDFFELTTAAENQLWNFTVFSARHIKRVCYYMKSAEQRLWKMTQPTNDPSPWSVLLRKMTQHLKKKNIGFSWSCFSRQNSNADDAINRTVMDGGGRWKWSQKESGKLSMKVPATAHLLHDRHSHGFSMLSIGTSLQSNLWQEFHEYIVSCEGITDNTQRPTQEPTYVIHRLRSSYT